MKKVKVKDLKRQLLALSKIVKTNAVVQVMACVKISNNFMEGRNMHTSIRIPFPCDGGEVVVDLALLREIVRKCKEEYLCFSVANETLKISSPDNKFNCQITGEKNGLLDFVKMNFDIVVEDGKDHHLKESYFPTKVAEYIGMAFPYCSKDDLKPALMCVLLGHNRVVATDAHRIIFKHFNYGVQSFNVNCKGNSSGVLLHTEVSKIINLIGSGFKMSISEDFVLIKLEEFGIELLQKKLSDTYPEYTAVIPDMDLCKSVFTVDKNTLLKTLLQSEFAQNKTTYQVQFLVNENKQTVKISAEDIDFDLQYSQVIDAVVKLPKPAIVQPKEGEEKTEPTELEDNTFAIAFNGKYLRQLITDCDDEVTFFMSTPSRPVLINTDLLLMPVLMNN